MKACLISTLAMLVVSLMLVGCDSGGGTTAGGENVEVKEPPKEPIPSATSGMKIDSQGSSGETTDE